MEFYKRGCLEEVIKVIIVYKYAINRLVFYNLLFNLKTFIFGIQLIFIKVSELKPVSLKYSRKS